MINHCKSTNLLHSFSELNGNTRVSVIFEPLWGIPYALYTFYLSLYMKSQGISDEQLGFLISIGCVSSIIFSMLGGMLTDFFGRKRTTLIFDLMAWPLTTLIYFFSHNFWMFALAQVVNSLNRIVGVSWNLMVVEDANQEQQVAAYNLLNAINISAGIFTPLAGVIVKQFGIVAGERTMLILAFVSMTTMILARNHCYQETCVGAAIIKERRERARGERFSFDPGAFRILREKPFILAALLFSILFNSYILIGTYTSLYYAPYLTEVLKLGKAAIATLGGINAGMVLAVFLFLIPMASGLNRLNLMICGAFIQIISLGLLIMLPPARFGAAALCGCLFALGYGITKPFVDSLLATLTGGKERAGIYAIYNTLGSACNAGLGVAAGILYKINPALIYILSILILCGCLGLLAWLQFFGGKGQSFRKTKNGLMSL